MKRIIYILLTLTFLASLSSCKKYLDVQPKEAVSDENVIFDKVSAETALNGTYRALGHSGYYGENYVTLGYFPSGDVVNGTTGGPANLILINFRADDAAFNSAWTSIYTVINRANHVIEKLPAVSDPALTKAIKNQYLGEALFLRALAYFDLARAFGGVQLQLKPTTTIDALPKIKRSTLEETYAQVLNDLAAADTLLPNPAANAVKVRATRKAVWALRARLHLYKKEWAQAEQYASLVIADSTNYPLKAPFNSWIINNVTATAESIFEVAFSAQNPSALRAQMQHPNRGGTYRYFPSNAIVAKFKDPNIGGGRRALIDSVKQGAVVQWFGNLYYRNPATDPSYVLRIAEQYLIRAEARAQLENVTEGLKDLNKIRKRAALPAATSSSKDELLLAIEEERRYEFFWEAHRWFDLARTGRAKAVLEPNNTGVNVADHEYIFPIPITQIQLDPDLTQNPGY